MAQLAAVVDGEFNARAEHEGSVVGEADDKIHVRYVTEANPGVLAVLAVGRVDAPPTTDLGAL